MSKTSACDGSSEFKVTLRKEHLNKAYHSGHYNKPWFKVALLIYLTETVKALDFKG